MARGNFKIEVDFDAIEKKLGPSSVKLGRLAMYSQAIRDMEDFIPKKKGRLRGSARQVEDGVEYATPYARAQYYGSSYNKGGSFTFNEYSTPGTGPRWDKKVSDDQKKKWGKMALEAMGFNT